jgi:hypothetical protein
LFPLWSRISVSLAIIIEFLAFKAVQQDICKSAAPEINKQIASTLNILSLIVGLIALAPLPPLWLGIAFILEVAFYFSIFYLLEGELPFIDRDPLESCWELLK